MTLTPDSHRNKIWYDYTGGAAINLEPLVLP